MPRTNSWLCYYSIAQLGRPYWYGTKGQIATNEVYASCVAPSPYYYPNYEVDLGKKVHDCSGLVLGALMCDTFNSEPTGSEPIYHGATSQFDYNCSTTSNTMSNFPYTPGTLVFTSNSEGGKSHVGIYVGDFVDLDGGKHSGEVVEAMGHDWGVVTSSIENPRWDSWGQLECCTIDTKKGQVFDVRTMGVAGAANIKTENMKPFVATLPPTASTKLDYDKIREARICAMMFFGGELYDIVHLKKTYVNPHLEDLVKQCDDAGMPYALYVNVRAFNEKEADAECRALYYVVSKYPPSLGVWLSLHTLNTVEMNDKILEIYYKYIVQWGLKDRIGLYMEPKKLDRITWASFQERFYFWGIEEMDVTKVDDELLQPEMFEVPD